MINKIVIAVVLVMGAIGYYWYSSSTIKNLRENIKN